MTKAEEYGPLLPDMGTWHERFGTWAAATALVSRLEALIEPPGPEHENRYGWEPLPLCDFLTGLDICEREASGRRLLVVGSGLGSKLYLAQQLGWDVHGIEDHAPYVRVSRERFPDCPVELADCMLFGGYGAFDVIYSYCPFTTRELESAHYERMRCQMQPGALLFVPGGVDPEHLAHVDFAVWRV